MTNLWPHEQLCFMGSLSIQDQNDDVIRAKMKKKEAEKLEKEKAKTKEEDEEDSGTR